jgi:predicted nucleotidyltransferase
MNKNILFEKIKDCLCKNKELEFAYLYGSYALNKQTALSDIDIAIYQKKNKSAYDLRKIEFKVESDLKTVLPENEFDLRSFNDAPIIVIGKILNEGKLLFYHNENFYYDYLVNKRIQYMDYLIVYNPLFNERYNNLLNDR